MIGIVRTERDASQVINPSTGEPYGMVLQVPFGPLLPTLISSMDDLVNYFAPSGKPDPDYKDYYEAEIMLKHTQIYASRPQGDALFGGVYVERGDSGNTIAGLGTGVSDPDNYTWPDTAKQFVLMGANPSADNNNYSVEISATTSEVANTFDIDLYYDGTLTQNFNVSLVRTQVDGFSNSVYIEEVMEGRKDIQVIVNPNADLTVLPEYTSSAVTFTGGVTITSFANTSYTTTAWAYFSEYNNYYTHHLVDCSCNSTIGKYVKDIAVANWYQMAWVGAPSIKSSNSRSTETLATWKTSLETYRDVNGSELNVNSDHITLCANWGRVTDNYNNTTLWISPVSTFASRKAHTVINISLSQAAVGANASRGLAPEFIELEQDPTSVLDDLQTSQINSLTYSPAGMLTWGEKTLQTAFSNTSFVSHRTYFNYLEENIENVLFYYVYTDINEEVRAEIRSLIETFTNPQIGVHAEDIQVRVPQDDDLAAQRKLKVQVAVIPYPKANQIIFEFIHSKSGTDLNEIF